MSDPNKTPMSLIPFDALETVAWALASGNVNGREPHDWQKQENTGVFLDAMLRHAGIASDNPEATDPDSGLDPLAHVAANALILLWHRQRQGQRSAGTYTTRPAKVRSLTAITTNAHARQSYLDNPKRCHCLLGKGGRMIRRVASCPVHTPEMKGE